MDLLVARFDFERKRNLEKFFQFSFPWTSEVIKSQKKSFAKQVSSLSENMIQKHSKNSVIFSIDLPNEFPDSEKYFHK